MHFFCNIVVPDLLCWIPNNICPLFIVPMHTRCLLINLNSVVYLFKLKKTSLQVLCGNATMYRNPFTLTHFWSFLRASSQHGCNMASCTIPSWLLKVTCPLHFKLMLIEVSNQRSDLLVIPRCAVRFIPLFTSVIIMTNVTTCDIFSIASQHLCWATSSQPMTTTTVLCSRLCCVQW